MYGVRNGSLYTIVIIVKTNQIMTLYKLKDKMSDMNSSEGYSKAD